MICCHNLHFFCLVREPLSRLDLPCVLLHVSFILCLSSMYFLSFPWDQCPSPNMSLWQWQKTQARKPSCADVHQVSACIISASILLTKANDITKTESRGKEIYFVSQLLSGLEALLQIVLPLMYRMSITEWKCQRPEIVTVDFEAEENIGIYI